MNITIKFNSIFLNQNFKWLVVIGSVMCVILFFFLKIDLSYCYFLCILIIFTGLLIVFYKNKNEPEKINIEGEKIELSFFNKVFFKRDICVFQKKYLKSQINEDVIELFEEDLIVAKIRKISLRGEDWEILKEYLTLDRPDMH